MRALRTISAIELIEALQKTKSNTRKIAASQNNKRKDNYANAMEIRI